MLNVTKFRIHLRYLLHYFILKRRASPTLDILIDALIKPVTQGKDIPKPLHVPPSRFRTVFLTRKIGMFRLASACAGMRLIYAFNRHTTTRHATFIRFSFFSMSKNLDIFLNMMQRKSIAVRKVWTGKKKLLFFGKLFLTCIIHKKIGLARHCGLDPQSHHI